MRCCVRIVVAALIAVAGCAAGRRSPLAISDEQENYAGRYMGGGAHFGHARRIHEGTWARDYAGLDLFHLIEMRWSHSARHQQGGIGSY